MSNQLLVCIFVAKNWTRTHASSMIIRLFLVFSFANNKSRVINLFSDESLHIGGVKTCRVEAAANGS